jgi:hypothetical protein
MPVPTAASITAFKKVLVQHMCPRAGPDDPLIVGSITHRYERHNWSPPTAVLISVSLAASPQPATPFYVVLALPTVALDTSPAPATIWTDSAQDAPHAPFQAAPCHPSIGTFAHSGAALVPDTKLFPSLDEWWSQPATWWLMHGQAAFQLAISQADIPVALPQHHPDLANFHATTVADLQAKLPHAAECTLPLDPIATRPALLLPTMLPLPAHHGLPIVQFFAHNIDVPILKHTLLAMGLPAYHPRLARSSRRIRLVLAFFQP